MAVTGFPPENLAKLVLGYLAEEQLLTAYDEFLKTSPYLDADQNEYDDVVMKSLSQIMAEYRAVKVLIRKCKPLTLRQKLLQFQSLYDLVKYILANVDLKKFVNGPSANQQQRTRLSLSSGKQIRQSFGYSGSLSHSARRDYDEYNCKSISVPENIVPETQKPITQGMEICDFPLEKLVQASHAASLPGNVVNDDPQIRKGKKDELNSHSKYESLPKQFYSGNNVQTSKLASTHCAQIENYAVTVDQESSRNEIDASMKTSQRMQPRSAAPITSRSQRISSTERSFQEFATGVVDSNRLDTAENLPDSSTPESSHNIGKIQRKANESSHPSEHEKNEDGVLSFAQKNISRKGTSDKRTSIDTNKRVSANSSKVTILTDERITLPKQLGLNVSDSEKIVVLASKSEVQRAPPLKTIMLNTTTSYRELQDTGQPEHRQDTVMPIPMAVTHPEDSGGTQAMVSAHSTDLRSSEESDYLQPLYIDIDFNEQPKTSVKSGVTNEPKSDNVKILKQFTPQVERPAKKCSSTPRRSHIRVLDFSTPKRPLNPSETSEVVAENIDTQKSLTHTKLQETQRSASKSASQMKKDWDADLRAIIAGNEVSYERPKPRKSKQSDNTKKNDKSVSKSKKTPAKTKQKDNSTKKSAKEKKDKTKKHHQKNKKNDRERETSLNAQTIESAVDKPAIPPKFTVKVVPSDKDSTDKQDVISSANKKEDKQITPETNISTISHPTCSKINISHLLDITPYKQALMDIQMETPKFLAPSLTGEPESIIKITDIPTPRFLDDNYTDKLATPPYASRATDYSSGSSYYKPDDQDAPLILIYNYNQDLAQNYPPKNVGENESNFKTPSKSKKPFKSVESTKKRTTVKSEVKSTRPVRSCRLRVSSYYDSPSSTIKRSLSPTIADQSLSSQEDSSSSSCSSIDVSTNKLKDYGELKDKATSAKMRKNDFKSDENVRKKSLEDLKKKRERTLAVLKSKMSPKNKVTKKTGSKFTKPNRKSDLGTKQRLLKSANTKATSVSVSPAIMKSRRKSSTPRKIECSNANIDLVVSVESCSKASDGKKSSPAVDSDCPPLHWSDEGSLDGKCEKEMMTTMKTSQISTVVKENPKYIATPKTPIIHETENMHLQFVKRGFDEQTAKKIERDLLNLPEPPVVTPNVSVTITEVNINQISYKNKEVISKIPSITQTRDSNELVPESAKISTNCSELDRSDNQLNIDLSTDIVLSEYCSDATTEKCFVYNGETFKKSDVGKLPDNYRYELYIDDINRKVPITLSKLMSVFEIEPNTSNIICHDINPPEWKHSEPNLVSKETCTEKSLEKDDSTLSNMDETLAAVQSITCIERLYTPLKDATDIQRQCIELFDSTLNSLDTPIKAKSPPKDCSREQTKVSDSNEATSDHLKNVKHTSSKRKRRSSGAGSQQPDVKKACSKPQYIANIENLDIESVLDKLHGP